ncbi:hypothetical protein GQ53DRAFT_710588 [Thozetella sp. PMI_491]|nr:hypothetical protein GQ53DRAFT_710588 [Thozetella sp. PMI_491]
MPRAKVAPENRQRGVRACRPCKLSKKRCDSVIPCTSCIRRNCPSACAYDPIVVVQPQRRSSASVFNPPSPSIVLSQSPSEPPQESTPRPVQDARVGNDSLLPPLLGSGSQTTNLEPWGEIRSDVAIGDVEQEPTPKGRMMVDSKGEKFYFGHSAGVSFLQFLRHVLLQRMGPCSFTEDNRRSVILEVAIPEDGDAFPLNLDSNKQKTLANNAAIAVRLLVYARGNNCTANNSRQTAGVIDLYTKEEMLHAVQNIDKLGSLKASIGYLILAIGAQCIVGNTDTTPSERSRYFKRGQQLAFSGMLEDLNIDVIYVFLLMSFYLLGACRRNTAFLYIGIAARSAHALGLHAPEQFQHLSIDEQNFRNRTWESLRVLDLVVASVLCRPPASLAFSHSQTSRYTRTSNTRHLAVRANFHLCSILEDVVRHLDEKRGISISAAEQFLNRFQRWSDSLPARLRKFSVLSPLAPAEHEVAIGNLRIACHYYFAVILVTRPALIAHLLPKLRHEHPQDPRTRESAKLARVCVDAAILMARLCRDAVEADIVIDNMCLLKAWIFTASLIIGFSKFAEFEPRFEIDDAFQAALGTLKRLAHPSKCPQAEHYVDLLTALSDAVAKHYQQMASERHRDSSLYVSQILVIDRLAGEAHDRTSHDSISETPDSMEQGCQDASDNMENGMTANGWYMDQPLGTGLLDGPGEVMGIDWGRDMDFPILGEGIFPTEPLRMIFDEI